MLRFPSRLCFSNASGVRSLMYGSGQPVHPLLMQPPQMVQYARSCSDSPHFTHRFLSRSIFSYLFRLAPIMNRTNSAIDPNQTAM
jgi:hypothetical protein